MPHDGEEGFDALRAKVVLRVGHLLDMIPVFPEAFKDSSEGLICEGTVVDNELLYFVFLVFARRALDQKLLQYKCMPLRKRLRS